jgi:hypothetical protein
MLSDEILTGMRDWRIQHPKATMREIEAELDTRLAGLRARMLQDIALRSAATDWRDAAPSERPTCPVCGTALVLRGKHPRHLKTDGGQGVTLTRSYGLCPTCKRGLFPPR